jgi:hypothetical protein
MSKYIEIPNSSWEKGMSYIKFLIQTMQSISYPQMIKGQQEKLLTKNLIKGRRSYAEFQLRHAHS